MALNPVTGTRIQRGVVAGPQTDTPRREPGATTGFEFSQGFKRGTGQAAATLTRGVSAVQAAAGFDDAARETLAQAEEVEQATHQKYGVARVGKVEDIDFNSEGWLGRSVDYLQQLTGSQIPILGTMAGASVLGGAVGGPVGAIAGAGVSSTALETGEIFGSITRDPEATGTLQEQALLSLGGGAAAGSMDLLAPARAIKVLGAGSLGRSLIGRAAREAVPTAGIEGVTEAAQTLIERGTHSFVNKNFEILGPDGASELLNAAVAGTLLGGGMGAITGALQRPATEEDLLGELEADEVTNRVLLNRRVEAARGHLPDEELNDFLNMPDGEIDDALLDELDARLPAEVLEARDAKVVQGMAEMAEKDPIGVAQMILSGIEEGRVTRAQVEVFRDILRTTMGNDNMRPFMEEMLSKYPRPVQEYVDSLAEPLEEQSPQRDSLNPDLDALSDEEFQASFDEAMFDLADTENDTTTLENFFGSIGQEQEEGVGNSGFSIAGTFEQDVDSQTGKSRYFLHPDVIPQRAEANGRPMSARDVANLPKLTPEARVARLEAENPGVRYEVVPARQDVEERINSLLDREAAIQSGKDPVSKSVQRRRRKLDNSRQLDKYYMRLVEARKHAHARNIEVDPNDLLSVFDDDFAVRRLKPPAEISGEADLHLTHEQLLGNISPEDRAKRARGEAPQESARFAAIKSNIVREPLKAKNPATGEFQEISRLFTGEQHKGKKRELLIRVDGDVMAVNASFLTKKALRDLRRAEDRLSGIETSKRSSTDATVEETAQAFEAGIAALVDVPRTFTTQEKQRIEQGEEVDPFVDVKLPKFHPNLVILTNAKQRPLVTWGDVLEARAERQADPRPTQPAGTDEDISDPHFTPVAERLAVQRPDSPFAESERLADLNVPFGVFENAQVVVAGGREFGAVQKTPKQGYIPGLKGRRKESDAAFAKRKARIAALNEVAEEQYQMLKAKLDLLLADLKNPTIVSGTAIGTDRLGERYAKERKLKVKKFPAKWNRPDGSFDGSAGFKRNEQMGENATHLVTFWNGESKGAEHMLNVGLEQELSMRTVRTDDDVSAREAETDQLADEIADSVAPNHPALSDEIREKLTAWNELRRTVRAEEFKGENARAIALMEQMREESDIGEFSNREFSERRGYTEAQIGRFEKFIRQSEELMNLGIDDDVLFGLEFQLDKLENLPQERVREATETFDEGDVETAGTVSAAEIAQQDDADKARAGLAVRQAPQAKAEAGPTKSEFKKLKGKVATERAEDALEIFINGEFADGTPLRANNAAKRQALAMAKNIANRDWDAVEEMAENRLEEYRELRKSPDYVLPADLHDFARQIYTAQEMADQVPVRRPITDPAQAAGQEFTPGIIEDWAAKRQVVDDVADMTDLCLGTSEHCVHLLRAHGYKAVRMHDGVTKPYAQDYQPAKNDSGTMDHFVAGVEIGGQIFVVDQPQNELFSYRGDGNKVHIKQKKFTPRFIPKNEWAAEYNTPDVQFGKANNTAFESYRFDLVAEDAQPSVAPSPEPSPTLADAEEALAQFTTAATQATKVPETVDAIEARIKRGQAARKAEVDKLADQILARVAEANPARAADEFEQVKDRLKHYNKKLQTKVRLANTVSVVNILSRRGDVKRLQRILDGTQQALTIGETVWVNPTYSIEAQMELMAHEVGHVLAGNTAPANFEPVFNAWRSWRTQFKGRDKLEDVARARRTLKIALDQFGSLSGTNLESLSDTELEYVLDFEEWFADQVSRWLISDEKKPKTSIKRWMSRFVNKSTTLFNDAKAEGELVDESVQHFLTKVIHTDTMAMLRIWRGTNRDARAPAAVVGTDPTTQYANQAMLAMIETGWIADKPLAALARVFSANSVVNRRIQDRIRPFSPATADLIKNDWKVATAYGFQMWSMGELELGPSGQKRFENISDWIFKALGEVGAFEQALEVSEQAKRHVANMQERHPDINFDDMVAGITDRMQAGGMTGASSAWTLNQVMKDTLLQRVAQTMKEVWGPYWKKLVERIFLPAYQRVLAMNNAAMTQIMHRLYTPVGTQGQDQGFINTHIAEISRWQGRFARALGKDVSPELAEEVLTAMQQGVPAASAEARAVIPELRKAFNEIADYAVQGGIELRQREDYFPWVYDIEALLERKDEWIDMMTAGPHQRIMENMLIDMQTSGPNTASDIQAPTYAQIYGINNIRDVADYYHSQLVGDEGYADTAVAQRVKQNRASDALRMDKTGHLPFVAALNARGLNFLQAVDDQSLKDKHSSFLSKDLNKVLRVYTEQLVKRVEWHRKFGHDGMEVLLDQALKLGATHEEMRLVQDMVDAAQGTLGMRTNQMLTKMTTGEDAPVGQVINPKLQALFSGTILWQNMRTLALAGFTSLADPAGILVRGGALDVGLAALKAGVNALNTDAMSTKVAEGLGIIDTYSIDQALASTYGTNFMTGRTRLWNERFFQATGLTFITKVTRAAATGAALQFLKVHKTDTRRKYLAELGLTAEDIVLDASGEVKLLTRPQIKALWESKNEADRAEVERDQRVRSAIRRFVDESILRPNAATRPIWGSDPHFQLIIHLKSFMYTFHSVIVRRIVNEAKEGNFFPAMTALLYFVPLMLFADMLRDRARFGLDGDPRKKNWGLMDFVAEGIERSGLYGLGQIYNDAKQSRQFGGIGVESFLGPTVGSMFQGDDLVFGPDRWNAFVDQLPGQNIVFIDQLKNK